LLGSLLQGEQLVRAQIALVVAAALPGENRLRVVLDLACRFGGGHSKRILPCRFSYGVRPSRIVRSFASSMFPPETTQTTLPPRPVSAAARPGAPAPSATIRARLTSRRTAAAASSIGTAKAPSSASRASGHIFASRRGDPEPSTNESVPSTSWGSPAASEAVS